MPGMFGLEIPLTDMLIIMGFSFLIIRWIVTRMVSTSKVQLFLMDAHGREGRMFRAEESIKENRVSYYKPLGGRKKERIDLKRTALPIKRYIGSRLETIYKAVEGQTATSEWVYDKDRKDVDVDTTYVELGAANATINSLESRATVLLGVNIQWLIMGFTMGVCLVLIFTIAFPEAF